jgi:hypothetical protein
MRRRRNQLSAYTHYVTTATRSAMISLTTDIIIQDGYYVCMYTAMYSVGTGISSTTGHAHH